MGGQILLLLLFITETLARVIRHTAYRLTAPTRETYLLWQVPQTVLGVRRVYGAVVCRNRIFVIACRNRIHYNVARFKMCQRVC